MSVNIPCREIAGVLYEHANFPIGTKIKFQEEKQMYTVRASNVAYSVVTKPFNVKHTVLYTIIDWFHNVRGPENLIFGMGADTDTKCSEMLERLTSGTTQVSRRNGIPLKIEKVIFLKGSI